MFGTPAPLVHSCLPDTLHFECINCSERTLVNIVSASLKSRSIASMSASLGVLGRNRPVSRCMRCIVQTDSNCVQSWVKE